MVLVRTDVKLENVSLYPQLLKNSYLCCPVVSASGVSLSDSALHRCPSPSPFLHSSPLSQPPREEWYCWCITTQDNLFKWQIRTIIRFVSNAVCSVCYQSNKVKLPTPFAPSSQPILLSIYPAPFACICRNKLLVQWEGKRRRGAGEVCLQCLQHDCRQGPPRLPGNWIARPGSCEVWRGAHWLIDRRRGASEICLAVVTNQSNN